MSLSPAQQQRTRLELGNHLASSGWTAERVAQALDLDLERVRAVLGMTSPRPADVWMVRDLLDEAVRQAGRIPQPYTDLPESSRTAAHAWFGISPRSAAHEAVARDAARRP